MIDIKGLDKAAVLYALYYASHAQGMGVFQMVPDDYVTVERCRELLQKNTYFDYLYGRVMKVDLSGDSFDERLYDRDNGIGAAESVIRRLRGTDAREVSGSFFVDTENDDIAIRTVHDFSRSGFEIRFRSIKALNRFISMCENLKFNMEAEQK